MKFALTIAALLLTATALPVPIPENTVSVTQDTAGNYRVAFNAGEISKIEERKADGTVVGSYSYIDGNGEKQTVSYVAGEKGFEIVSSLPVEFFGRSGQEVPLQVTDTPEVAAARAAHFAALEEARKAAAVGGSFDEEN